MYYNHLGSVAMDETLTKINAHELQIAGWTLTKYQKLMKFHMGINVQP